MAGDNTTHWTITVSKDTDIVVRTFLARRGLKSSDLSDFVEEAVKWRVFEQTTAEAREAFADLAPEAAQDLVNEATKALRDDLRKAFATAPRKEP
jgi:hypothetical protein